MASVSRKIPLIDRIKVAVPVGTALKLKAVAESLRVSQRAIEDEVDGSFAGVCLNVGIRCGSGTARLARRDWEVEHYGA
jgi:hypothetical protein